MSGEEGIMEIVYSRNAIVGPGLAPLTVAWYGVTWGGVRVSVEEEVIYTYACGGGSREGLGGG